MNIYNSIVKKFEFETETMSNSTENPGEAPCAPQVPAFERFKCFSEKDYVPEFEEKVKTLDVVLLKVNYRKSTLMPIPFLLLGAVLLTVSLFVQPWLEYTILAEGLTFNSIFRQHVKTSLFERCRTRQYNSDWSCEPLTGTWTAMVGIQAFLVMNTAVAWAAVLVAAMQSGRSWLNETSEDVTKNVPGVMLLELTSGILAVISVIQIVVTLVWFQSIDGGSASIGFFLCEVGVVLLFLGAVFAIRVATQPLRNPLPWKIREINDDDEESCDTTSDNSETS